MEVSGRKADPDVAAGSAEVTPLCDPCRAQGKELEAHGFCNSCKEYMCPSCITVHGKLTATKHHNVLGKQEMPNHYPSSRKAADVTGLELCQDHPSEAIKFFCLEHAQLGCGDCIVLNHRACKVDYIPEVAPSFTSSKEFKVIIDKVAKLEANLKSTERKLESNEQSVIDISKRQLKKLQEFRVEIKEYIDKQENALIKSMDDIRKKDADLIQRIREDINAAKAKLGVMKARLNNLDNNANQLFVTAIHAEKQLVDMNTLVKKVETEKLVTSYIFNRDMKTRDLLAWTDAVGTVYIGDDFSTTTWSHEENINIKTPEDKYKCWITGSTLSREENINIKSPEDRFKCWITGTTLLRPGVLFLADSNNRCVKTVDLTTDKVKARLTLDGTPWDVCVLPGDRAAITLPAYPQSKIQFISTGKTLKSDKCIKVPARCRGISYNDDKIYLSFMSTPPGIEIRTLKGDILQTINNTSFQREVFSDPRYLTITSRGDISTIYVSDYYNDTVVQLSLQGELLHTFSHKELSYPHGLVDVGGGQVLVCCSASQTVMAISGRDGSMKTILGKEDGLNGPYTVAYCQTQKKLVVGGPHDQVNVYTII